MVSHLTVYQDITEWVLSIIFRHTHHKLDFLNSGEIQIVMSMTQIEWQTSLCNVMIHREIDTMSPGWIVCFTSRNTYCEKPGLVCKGMHFWAKHIHGVNWLPGQNRDWPTFSWPSSNLFSFIWSQSNKNHICVKWFMIAMHREWKNSLLIFFSGGPVRGAGILGSNFKQPYPQKNVS